jgi:hypothetical protein
MNKLFSRGDGWWREQPRKRSSNIESKHPLEAAAGRINDSILISEHLRRSLFSSGSCYSDLRHARLLLRLEKNDEKCSQPNAGMESIKSLDARDKIFICLAFFYFFYFLDVMYNDKLLTYCELRFTIHQFAKKFLLLIISVCLLFK